MQKAGNQIHKNKPKTPQEAKRPTSINMTTEKEPKKQSYLAVNTQGKRGKDWTGFTEKGAVALEIENTFASIQFDAFEGQGDTYQRREETLITIEDDKFKWQGTYDQLIEKLMTAPNNSNPI